jgi:hypothetical protein
MRTFNVPVFGRVENRCPRDDILRDSAGSAQYALDVEGTSDVQRGIVSSATVPDWMHEFLFNFHAAGDGAVSRQIRSSSSSSSQTAGVNALYPTRHYEDIDSANVVA